MSIEINGVVYNKEDIQSHIDKYISYLQGLSSGLYSATNGEVGLLELSESKDLETVISKLQSFSRVADDIAGFDFNASGVGDANDIELLKSIIDKNDNEGGLEIDANRREFITAGGYKIKTSANAQNVQIYRPDGTLMTKIWGDPHVNEYDENGNATGTWHYADDSMFILPDGTELVMNSQARSSNVMVNRGLYVRNGDTVAHFGLEFGEGRNNANSDVEEGATRGMRILDIDADEWDASVADFNSTGKRNGVFAFVNGQWAMKKDDGNFYDLNSETWASYRGRTDKALHTNGEALAVNRDQLIAALDGQDVLTLKALRDLDLGEFQVDVVNRFLADKTNFNDRLIQQLGLLKDFGAEKEDLFALINGGATQRQAKFLNKVLDFVNKFSNGKSINADVKKSVLDKYFGLNPRNERPAHSAKPEIDRLALDLLELDIRDNNPFSDYLGQVYANSIFAEGDIAVDKIRAQSLFLARTNGKKDFIRSNRAQSKALDLLLASKFFDVDAEKLARSLELLTDNQERHIDLIYKTFKVLSVEDHSYENQFEELFDKIMDPKAALAVLNNDFSLFGSSRRGGSFAQSSRYRSGSNRTSNLLRIVEQFINSPDADFEAFASKIEMILALQNESSDDPVVEEANSKILLGIASIKLEQLRTEQNALESELQSLEGSNSRYDDRRRRDINRLLRNISAEINAVIAGMA